MQQELLGEALEAQRAVHTAPGPDAFDLYQIAGAAKGNTCVTQQDVLRAGLDVQRAEAAARKAKEVADDHASPGQRSCEAGGCDATAAHERSCRCRVDLKVLPHAPQRKLVAQRRSCRSWPQRPGDSSWSSV